MNIIEIILLSISLAMDAFAVSICKSMNKNDIKKSIIMSLYFGTFQAIMPLLGFFFGFLFKEIIIFVDHYLAFMFLSIIGSNMIYDVVFKKGEEIYDDNINFKTMIGLAIATSIDAFTVGITFAILNINIILSIFIIGTMTFTICMFGCLLGNFIGKKLGKWSQVAGGIFLIVLGLKILIEHIF